MIVVLESVICSDRYPTIFVDGCDRRTGTAWSPNAIANLCVVIDRRYFLRFTRSALFCFSDGLPACDRILGRLCCCVCRFIGSRLSCLANLVVTCGLATLHSFREVLFMLFLFGLRLLFGLTCGSLGRHLLE